MESDRRNAGPGDNAGEISEPPRMAGWNLGLRFGLEMAALLGIAVGVWNAGQDAVRWIATPAVLVIVMVVWGLYIVPGDPSRSGLAPVRVSGPVRLLIETVVFGVGLLGLVVAGWRVVSIGFGVLAMVHYLVSHQRIRWLLGFRGQW